ncbi:hypothetical protein [Asticcacaulis sp. YBE204]|uniref:hypothetical protein n=1 Tax=Asticcacaulis sp. YBE204 TaxID=1282363 RepID=UPI0003C3B3F8|nr:hypothetical protein [Asticcacaulis sp. YBE204]ESQ78823.1 hypothetical protein AEYBE204_12635 [Asticcacaulis sp. YBE204]
MEKLVSRLAITLIAITAITAVSFFAGFMSIIFFAQNGIYYRHDFTNTLFLSPFMGLYGTFLALCFGFPLALVCKKLRILNRLTLSIIGGMLGLALGLIFANGNAELFEIGMAVLFTAAGILSGVIAESVWRRSEKINLKNVSVLR